MRNVYNLFSGFEKQGWSTDTMALLMAQWINKYHLTEFKQHLSIIASEENTELAIASDLYEPEEGDYTTEDYSNFYQYGKCRLTVHADEDWKAEIQKHMNKNKFWPNVWFISDHGNAHLLSLE